MDPSMPRIKGSHSPPRKAQGSQNPQGKTNYSNNNVTGTVNLTSNTSNGAVKGQQTAKVKKNLTPPTHTLSLSLYLSVSLSISLSLSLSLSLSHTHKLSLSLFHTHSLSLSFSLSLEADDRKRGYNSMTTIDVSLEDMEVIELKYFISSF